MVFFQRKDGAYVMHRIHHIRDGKLYIVGDNQTQIEGPIDPEQVFGIVRKVIRKGKILQEGDFWWNFFEKVWIRIVPLRPAVITSVICNKGWRRRGIEKMISSLIKKRRQKNRPEDLLHVMK